MKTRWSLLNLVVLLALAMSGLRAAGQVTNMPLVSDEFSVFNISAEDETARKVVFTLPSGPSTYPYLVSVYPPQLVPGYPTALNPKSPENMAAPTQYSGSLGEWEDQAMAANVEEVNCGNNEIIDGLADVALLAEPGMYVMTQDNMMDELANRVIPSLNALTWLTFTYQSVNMNFKIQGGEFDGTIVTLHGVMAYGSGPNPNDDDVSQEEWDGQMYVLLNWALIRWGTQIMCC
jgi:hypothetical protein